jgi:protein TonB
MKSIITFAVCMTFAMLMNAQVQDSVRSSDKMQIISVETDKKESAIIEEEVFLVVEVMPEFPGGKEALLNYLGENILYPQLARESNIQGTVFVTFIVEPDGSLSKVKVMRGIGGGCDEEAVRVVQAMPNWIPGTQRGKPVRVQFNLPVRFILH